MRKSNIDILRIFAILFVIGHHCIINDFGLQNILRNNLKSSTEEVAVMALLNSVFIIGVNIFFLLSGYLRISFKWSKIVALALKTYIIYGFIALLGLYIGYLKIDIKFIQHLLDPLDMYWFIMTYILLYITSPLLNIILDEISIIMSKKYFLGVIFICCGYGFLIDSNLHIINGYSYLMAVALYLLGGILSKIMFIRNTRKCIFYSILCVTINSALVLFFYLVGCGDIAWKMYSYNNPLVVLYSIFILLIFLNIPENLNLKIIEKLATSTFCVYIVHSTNWLSEIRKIPIVFLVTRYGFLTAICFLPCYIMLIYLVGFCIDYFYEKYNKKLIELLQRKISRFIEKIIRAICSDGFES